MDIQDLLPTEILNYIMSYLDYTSILSMYALSSKSFTINLSLLLRQYLYKITKYNTSNYNIKGLINLCHILIKNSWVNAGTNYSLILSNNNHVYKLENNNKILLIKNISQISMGYNYALLLTCEGIIYKFKYKKSLSNLIIIHNINHVIQVSAGFNHSLALTNNGQVYSFGQNNYGELGFPGDNNRHAPTLLHDLKNIVQISAGYHHSLLLTDNGQVYVCGNNKYGQLGLGYNNNCQVPVLNNHINNIIQVSAGFNHTLLLRYDGCVYTCGNNMYGQLADGTNSNFSNMPLLIPNIYNIKQISNGYHHSLLLTKNGQVYALGYNKHGQLGLNDKIDRNIPTLINTISCKIEEISSGSSHSLILTNNGKIINLPTIYYDI